MKRAAAEVCIIIGVSALLCGCVTGSGQLSLSVDADGYYDDDGLYHYVRGNDVVFYDPADYYYDVGGVFYHHHHRYDHDVVVTVVPQGYYVAPRPMYFPPRTERYIRHGSEWKGGYRRLDHGPGPGLEPQRGARPNRGNRSRIGEAGNRPSPFVDRPAARQNRNPIEPPRTAPPIVEDRRGIGSQAPGRPPGPRMRAPQQRQAPRMQAPPAHRQAPQIRQAPRVQAPTRQSAPRHQMPNRPMRQAPHRQQEKR